MYDDLHDHARVRRTRMITGNAGARRDTQGHAGTRRDTQGHAGTRRDTQCNVWCVIGGVMIRRAVM